MMLPTALRETLAFVEGRLQGRRAVLEIGCGRGDLAVLLAKRGHQVTAIDAALEDRKEDGGVRFARADILEYSPEQKFDAIVLIASLHHLVPLDRAALRIQSLLVPGGIVVVDDFDLAAIDAPTARWNYQVQDLLLAAGRAPRDHVHGSPDDPPLVRWRSEHQHGGVAVHDGAAMLGALERAGLEQVEIARGPYLYRYATSIANSASEEPVARAIGEHVLATERRLLSEGVVAPIGLRAVARRNG